MYEAFYGLTEKPFNLTPDPRFLFLSEKHEEAFAHLLYGIQNRSGFIMVSGEIGTGKTTICRSLLKQLGDDTEVAFIFNPKLSPEELLGTINADFGLSSTADTVRGLVDELNEFLLERSAKGKNCVLIIDEAQNLGIETLEQVRLLSNLETETEKLLQIVLIGQPELAEMLTLPELRQLNQRITARYHLGPLDYTETLNYIAFRLAIAGGRKRVRFTRRAVKRVYRISGGTPRVINALCDRALLIGFTKEATKITPKLVKQAALEVQGEARPRLRKLNIQRFLPASAFLSASAVAVLLIILLNSGPLPSFDWWDRDDASTLSARTALPATALPEETSGSQESAEEKLGAEAVNVVEAASRPVAKMDAASEKIEPASSNPESEAPVKERVARALDSNPATSNLNEIEAIDLPTSGAISGAIPDLLRAWNLAVLGDLPSDDSIGALRAFAVSNGLRFARLTLTLDEVATINLPIITRASEGDRAGWYAVLGMDGDRVRIASHGTSEVIAPGKLDELYSGEAFYLWPDPNSDRTPLRVGSDGQEVRQLQSDLQALGLFEYESTSFYDAKTVDVVTKIQRATGLNVDGIVGPQTRMVIGSWLPSRQTPALAKPGFTTAARARVLASPGMIVADNRALQARRAAREVARMDGEGASDASFRDPPEDRALPRFTEETPNASAASRNQDAGSFTLEEGEESARIVMEPLEEQEYRPQLEQAGGTTGGGVTPSAGPIVPIVPSADRVGERE